MDLVNELLKTLDIGNLVAMALMFWFFYTRLEAKIEKVDQRVEKLEQKIEKLDVKVTDIDRRVFAIETLLHMKDCCVLKADSQIKKAE